MENDSSQVEFFCNDSIRLGFFQHHFALFSFLDFFDNFYVSYVKGMTELLERCVFISSETLHQIK